MVVMFEVVLLHIIQHRNCPMRIKTIYLIMKIDFEVIVLLQFVAVAILIQMLI